MATCPSCSAMIEDDASECWQCGVNLAEAAAMHTASGAPTLLAPGADPATARHVGNSMIGRELIGQYTIRAKLGEGGMGEVYLADQPTVGRQVAIKIVHSQVRERDQDEHIERFRNEAKAAASLESPHIVQIFNWGELEDGTSFMAMEYLRGQTLGEILRERGQLEPAAAVNIATQICTALSEAHAAGIVHRDLKPSNIMLVPRGDDEEPSFVKVLDFGVAKLEGADITRSGAMFGTPQYMSPEQLRTDKLDGRSDLYSLGVMLYELLAGELPFSAPTAIGYVTAHLHDEPPKLPKSLPRALADVVNMMMAKEPDERPASAADVANMLEDALAGRSPSGARRRARRRVLRRMGATVLVLGALGGAGYGVWWLQESRAETERALAAERAKADELEKRMAEQEAAVERARREVRETAEAQQRETTEAREQSREVQKKVRSRTVDEDTRKLLTRSRKQLEIQHRRTLESRKILPSKAAKVFAAYDAAVEQYEAGTLDEGALRDHLVSEIVIYNRKFEPLRPDEARPLGELEAQFMTMATKEDLDESRRRELLDAIHEASDAETQSEIDRDYFKRIGVAGLIREQRVDKSEASEAEPEPKPKSDPVENLPGIDDEPAATTGSASLPSLTEGM